MNRQAGFFDVEDDGPEATDERSRQRPSLVVTNRSNLVDFVASGLLRPMEAMNKYYEDTLQLTPGALPVVAKPASDELITLCEREAGNFAVLVELDADAVAPTEDPSVGYVEVETMAAVRAVHVRTEKQLTELTARRFDNADLKRLPLHISPEHFGGDGPGPDVVTAAVGTRAPTEINRDYDTPDRLGGARLLALHASPGTRTALRQTAQLTLGSDPVADAPAGLAPWARPRHELREYEPQPDADYDERVFRAAAATFMNRPHRDVWDGLTVLDQVGVLLAVDEGLVRADRERWQQTEAQMRAYLTATKPFTGFETSTPSSDRGLLLALIRGEVEAVLAWRDAETGARWEDLVLAALLVGLVHGRSVCPLSLRPPAVDDILAAIERAEILGAPSPSPSVEVAGRIASETREVVLLLDSQPVLTKPEAPRSATEVLDELDIDSSTVQAALAQVAAARGWQDTILTVVEAPGSFEHTIVDGRSRIVVQGEAGVRHGVDAGSFRRSVEADADPELARLLESAVDDDGGDERSAPSAPGGKHRRR